MKWRSVLFIIAGALSSVAGVAYAATAAQSPGGETSVGVIVAVAFSALSQLGSTAMLVKRYMTKVDEDGKIIPELVAALKASSETLKEHAVHLEHLYTSRNTHENALTSIATLHKFKKCDVMQGTAS